MIIIIHIFHNYLGNLREGYSQTATFLDDIPIDGRTGRPSDRIVIIINYLNRFQSDGLLINIADGNRTMCCDIAIGLLIAAVIASDENTIRSIIYFYGADISVIVNTIVFTY